MDLPRFIIIIYELVQHNCGQLFVTLLTFAAVWSGHHNHPPLRCRIAVINITIVIAVKNACCCCRVPPFDKSVTPSSTLTSLHLPTQSVDCDDELEDDDAVCCR